MLLFGVIAHDAAVGGHKGAGCDLAADTVERNIFVRTFGLLLLLQRYFQNLVGLRSGLVGLVDLGFGRHLVMAAQTVIN